MREILFKAKRIDNGKWIEGHYTECRGETFIGIDTSSMFHSSMVYHAYIGMNNYCNRCGQKLDWGKKVK